MPNTPDDDEDDPVSQHRWQKYLDLTPFVEVELIAVDTDEDETFWMPMVPDDEDIAEVAVAEAELEVGTLWMPIPLEEAAAAEVGDELWLCWPFVPVELVLPPDQGSVRTLKTTGSWRG